MPALNQSVEECLSATGPLAGDWPGYRVREEQVQLAVEVEKGLAEELASLTHELFIESQKEDMST